MFLDFKNKSKTIVLRKVPAMAKMKFKMQTAILFFTNEEQKTHKSSSAVVLKNIIEELKLSRGPSIIFVYALLLVICVNAMQYGTLRHRN